MQPSIIIQQTINNNRLETGIIKMYMQKYCYKKKTMYTARDICIIDRAV